jgi:hypothetical protein
MIKFTIEQKEQEGWEKAFSVIADGKVIAHFTNLEDARHFVMCRAPSPSLYDQMTEERAKLGLGPFCGSYSEYVKFFC